MATENNGSELLNMLVVAALPPLHQRERVYLQIENNSVPYERFVTGVRLTPTVGPDLFGFGLSAWRWRQYNVRLQRRQLLEHNREIAGAGDVLLEHVAVSFESIWHTLLAEPLSNVVFIEWNKSARCCTRLDTRRRRPASLLFVGKYPTDAFPGGSQFGVEVSIIRSPPPLDVVSALQFPADSGCYWSSVGIADSKWMTFKLTASFNDQRSGRAVVVRESLPTASKLLRPAVSARHCLVLYSAWADSTPLITEVKYQRVSDDEMSTSHSTEHVDYVGLSQRLTADDVGGPGVDAAWSKEVLASVRCADDDDELALSTDCNSNDKRPVNSMYGDPQSDTASSLRSSDDDDELEVFSSVGDACSKAQSSIAEPIDLSDSEHAARETTEGFEQFGRDEDQRTEDWEIGAGSGGVVLDEASDSTQNVSSYDAEQMQSTDVEKKKTAVGAASEHTQAVQPACDDAGSDEEALGLLDAVLARAEVYYDAYYDAYCRDDDASATVADDVKISLSSNDDADDVNAVGTAPDVEEDAALFDDVMLDPAGTMAVDQGSIDDNTASFRSAVSGDHGDLSTETDESCIASDAADIQLSPVTGCIEQDFLTSTATEMHEDMKKQLIAHDVDETDHWLDNLEKTSSTPPALLTDGTQSAFAEPQKLFDDAALSGCQAVVMPGVDVQLADAEVTAIMSGGGVVGRDDDECYRARRVDANDLTMPNECCQETSVTCDITLSDPPALTAASLSTLIPAEEKLGLEDEHVARIASRDVCAVAEAKTERHFEREGPMDLDETGERRQITTVESRLPAEPDDEFVVVDDSDAESAQSSSDEELSVRVEPFYGVTDEFSDIANVEAEVKPKAVEENDSRKNERKTGEFYVDRPSSGLSSRSCNSDGCFPEKNKHYNTQSQLIPNNRGITAAQIAAYRKFSAERLKLQAPAPEHQSAGVTQDAVLSDPANKVDVCASYPTFDAVDVLSEVLPNNRGVTASQIAAYHKFCADRLKLAFVPESQSDPANEEDVCSAYPAIDVIDVLSPGNPPVVKEQLGILHPRDEPTLELWPAQVGDGSSGDQSGKDVGLQLTDTDGDGQVEDKSEAELNEAAADVDASECSPDTADALSVNSMTVAECETR